MRSNLISGIIDKYYIKRPKLRYHITKLIYGNKDHLVNLFGKEFVVNALRENGYYRASRFSRHSSLFRDELTVLNRLPLFFEENMTFVDAGANVGMFSVMMADFQKIIPSFKVVAFEVHPGTFQRLERNAQRYHFSAHNVGLSSKSEVRDFVEGAVSHVTCLSEDSNGYIISGRKFEAKVERLDAFDLPGTLALKIDVEGHEFEVLQGAAGYFEDGRIKLVYIDGFGADHRVPELLKSYGFDLFDCQTLDPTDGQVHSLMAVKGRARYVFESSRA